ncbi:pentatricopeptide repeat-containing protein mitochondrial [Dorcoceras hygrometricum]|uniref:Pentatricopeptide repeat-containing protein mitochondrial n=1 Tax=Dorcoceras hygrometricum TaxID=472368 RepID=A0A2Z7BAR2_9LAMI|nr:pentatricopeptide repeat-containing protein mitochondrial [Dorcoceras hygrometricum]
MLVHSKLLHCRSVARDGRAFSCSGGVVTREGASAKLSLGAHMEELCEENSYARRCQSGIGLRCRADRAFVLRWGCHPRRCQYGTGLKRSCRRATRGGTSAELGLDRAGRAFVFRWGCHPRRCQYGTGLKRSCRRATRGGTSAELGLDQAGRAFVFRLYVFFACEHSSEMSTHQIDLNTDK